MQDRRGAQIEDRLIRFWWSKLPLLARRLSVNLSLVLTDGIYLVAWPRLAAFLPMAALFLGFVAGFYRLGAPQIFTQSLLTLSLGVVLGFLSAHLGFMFVLGYAVTDFLLYAHPGLRAVGVLGILELRVALLLTYLAFAMIIVIVPLFVKTLRGTPPVPLPVAAEFGLAFESLVAVIASGLLVFLYFQALPLLVRPLFVWQGFLPPVNAIFPLQHRAWVLAGMAAVVSQVRLFGEYVAATVPDHIEDLTGPLQTTVPVPVSPQPIRIALQIVLESLLATLLLGGLFESRLAALITFLGFVALGLARLGLGWRLQAWSRAMQRIPVLWRLVAVVVAAYYLSLRFLPVARATNSFHPFIWSLLAGLAIAALLFPLPPRGERS